MRLLVCLTLLFIMTAAVGHRAVAESRTWTSSSGTFTIEAEVKSVKQDTVVLLTSDGREIDVPMSKLCDEDRQYVEAMTSASATDKALIKELVVAFYEAVKNDPQEIRDFLTSEDEPTLTINGPTSPWGRRAVTTNRG